MLQIKVQTSTQMALQWREITRVSISDVDFKPQGAHMPETSPADGPLTADPRGRGSNTCRSQERVKSLSPPTATGMLSEGQKFNKSVHDTCMHALSLSLSFSPSNTHTCLREGFACITHSTLNLPISRQCSCLCVGRELSAFLQKLTMHLKYSRRAASNAKVGTNVVTGCSISYTSKSLRWFLITITEWLMQSLKVKKRYQIHTSVIRSVHKWTQSCSIVESHALPPLHFNSKIHFKISEPPA